MQNTIHFLKLVVLRFFADSCPRTAASLSYTTILSLAPLLVIAFALIGAFPAFAGVESQIRELIFSTFVPTTGSAIHDYLTQFSQNAGKLTTLGIVVLVLTVILLLLNIQDAFDSIFKSAQKHPFLFNLLKFWAFITLGPLLMGTSLSMSSVITAEALTLDIPGFDWIHRLYSVGLNGLIEFFAFCLLYAFMPNTTVLWRHAILGAVVTSLLFKLLKAGFGFYITTFPTYEAIYGTLATIPIFLFWVYLCWMAALFGAELVAALPEYRRLTQADPSSSLSHNHSPYEVLSLSLQLLALLRYNAEHGQTTRLQDLLKRLDASAALIHKTLRGLKEKGYILALGANRFSPFKDLGCQSLFQLCDDLEILLHPSPQTPVQDGMHTWLNSQLASADQLHEHLRNLSIRDALMKMDCAALPVGVESALEAKEEP